MRNELRAPPGDRAILADSAMDVALFAVHLAATENADFGAISHALRALRAAEGIAEAAARLRLFPVIREVIGPSAVRLFLRPEWRTPTAVSLAERMYQLRDFAAMPVLADALEEAGCNWEELLEHCRGGVDHVRGCWAVDLVLGKG